MLAYRSESFGNILNLSKHSFSLNTYNLVNRNLNFIPSPKQYSLKELDTDTENFFCLSKLRVDERQMPMKDKCQTNYIKLSNKMVTYRNAFYP